MKILLIFLLLVTLNLYSQNNVKTFDHLTVPSELKESADIAIQYFPELTEVKIEIVYSNIKTTMATRPIISSMFSKHRKYKIFVDTLVENNFGVLVSQVPLDAKIGLFGHEFAHILDYESKSNFEIINMGKTYLTKGDIRPYEIFIDQLTIQKGLGFYLLAWADYVLNQSNASDSYKAFKRKNYLSPQEIQGIITK